MKEISIIINGVRYDAVEASENGCTCYECDLEKLCDREEEVEFCATFVGSSRCFKKSKKGFEP